MNKHEHETESGNLIYSRRPIGVGDRGASQQARSGVACVVILLLLAELCRSSVSVLFDPG